MRGDAQGGTKGRDSSVQLSKKKSRRLHSYKVKKTLERCTLQQKKKKKKKQLLKSERQEKSKIVQQEAKIQDDLR